MSESMDESVLGPNNRRQDDAGGEHAVTSGESTDVSQAIPLPGSASTHAELVDFLLAHATHPQTPVEARDQAVGRLLQIRTARWEQMNAEA
jgi:hypothetical protein